MMNHENSNATGITLSPKASFVLGLVGGVLVLCTIGFFILLSMTLKGGGVRLAGGSPSVAAGNVPSAADLGGTEPVGEVKPIVDEDHVLGDRDADVVLYEYSDFECPFCARFHPSMKQLMDDPAFKGKIAWVYRHYPLSFHAQATPSANASECAAEQGKFWEYADGLIENQAVLGEAFYPQLADKLGLNKSKFADCYSSKKYQGKISADQMEGSTAGVTGTPGTIIVGKDGSKQLVLGAVPYEQLKAMVESAM